MISPKGGSEIFLPGLVVAGIVKRASKMKRRRWR